MKMKMKTWALLGMAMGSLALSGGVVAQGMMGQGDTKITKEEFLKRAEARFERMDANHDGVVDAQEHQKMREHMRGQMGRGHKGMMGMMDCMGPMGDGAAPVEEHHPATPE